MIEITGPYQKGRINGQKMQVLIPTTDGLFTVKELCRYVQRVYHIDLSENTFRTRMIRYPWNSNIMLAPPNKGGYSIELRKLRELEEIPPSPHEEEFMQESPLKVKYEEGCFAHLQDTPRDFPRYRMGTWEQKRHYG